MDGEQILLRTECQTLIRRDNFTWCGDVRLRCACVFLQVRCHEQAAQTPTQLGGWDHGCSRQRGRGRFQGGFLYVVPAMNTGYLAILFVSCSTKILTECRENPGLNIGLSCSSPSATMTEQSLYAHNMLPPALVRPPWNCSAKPANGSYRMNSGIRRSSTARRGSVNSRKMHALPTRSSPRNKTPVKMMGGSRRVWGWVSRHSRLIICVALTEPGLGCW